MKIKRIEVWVGLFVVMGIAALLMLALQVSGLSDFYNVRKGYTVYASFTNIGGLKIRSKVTISGVTIGRVVGVSLQANNYGEYHALVELSIDSSINKIPDDSSAKILTAGLLGDNYIGIVPGQSKEFLHEGSTIELTSQALLLEDLVSKFAVGGASK